MTSLTFYGGVNEIGGNKILLQDKDTKVFLDFGMSRVQSHCSGHARGRDLLEAVSNINAKTLFPVHTEHPDAYNKVSKNLILIDEGKKYNIS
jgi:mRNA degradation ribonuclease J1/J2